MPSALDVLATARPEGGAVRLTFGLTDAAFAVRVLRVPQGDPAPGPSPGAAHLVFDGAPPQTDAEHRFHRAHPEPQARYEVWDLEAFSEHFADTPNEIDGSAWDYHLYALDEAGNAGDPQAVTVSVARRLRTDFAVNVKELAYQRARYHARAIGGGLFAAKLEHLHNEPPPQILVKARYQQLHTHAGEARLHDGSAQVSATFRGIVEALLISKSPDERDDLGDQLAERLLGDLHLLGELGWDGLTVAYQDGMSTFAEHPHYTRTFTLDGLVDAHIIREPAPPIATRTAAWRVEVD